MTTSKSSIPENSNVEEKSDTEISADKPSTEISVEAKATQPKIKNQVINDKLNQIEDSIAQVSAALKEGQLSAGIKLHSQCHESLQELRKSNFKSNRLNKLQKKHNANYYQIRELKDWKQWGVDQNRVKLIQRLENLKDFEGDPQELYTRIKAIKKLWEHWNQSGSYPSHALRVKYGKAFDQAFQPCRQYLNEQKKLRKQNKKVRVEICSHLEELFDTTDWNNPDWKAISKILRESRISWKKAVPLNKKDWTYTNSRYDRVYKKIEPYLQAERERGIDFRRDLIAKVNSLDSQPLRDAINQTKECQKQWQLVVIRARKRKEKDLWNQFKSACDRQFERRKKLRQEIKEKTQEQVTVKRDLINKYKKLNALPVAQAKDSTRAASTLQKKWKRFSVTDKRANRSLQTQFNHEVSKFQRQAKLAQKQAVKSNLTVLSSKASICEEFEQLVYAGKIDSKLQLLQTRWNGIKDDCGQPEATINSRFAKIMKLAENPASINADKLNSQLSDNLEIKQEVCLKLEILSELESPPEFKRERMILNVQRLNDAIAKHKRISKPEDEKQKLLIEYWLTGTVPSDEFDSLQQRFNRIQEAYLKTL